MVQAEQWGTWEELVLGGAVVRHGTANWETVASELRSRTAFPHLFTAQVCEARYVYLQELYCGCHALFEELRERRIAELKNELAKTAESIGSLESKLENLTAEKESDCNNFDCDPRHIQLISPSDDANGIDYSCKDGLSAGSSTRSTPREWTPECDITVPVSLQADDINNQLHDDLRMEMAGNLWSHFGYEHFRKKRGPRKRKICGILNEARIGESEGTSSVAKIDGRESFERDEPAADLVGIVDSISKEKDHWVLPDRLENQVPSQPRKLQQARASHIEKVSSVIQAIEKGRLLGSPARKNDTGRPPKGGRRGCKGCGPRQGRNIVTC